MNEIFPDIASVRAHARNAFANKETRVAPITALLAQHHWDGIIAWYNEYDIAAGKPNPYTGDEAPTGH